MRVKVPPRIAARRRKYKHRIYGNYIDELVDRAMQQRETDQRNLGKAIGVDHTKLSEYRNGVSHPGRRDQRRLVTGLDGDEDEMIARELADKALYLVECMGVTVDQRARAWRLMRGKSID